MTAIDPIPPLFAQAAAPKLSDQCARVLAALRRGPVGTIDGIRAELGDGGPPILRLAARAYDLRKAGYAIERTLNGAGGTAIYTLRTDNA